MNRGHLFFILTALVIVLATGALLLSRRESQNQEVQSLIARLEGTVATQDKLIEQLSAGVTKQEKAAGERFGAMEAAVAVGQQALADERQEREQTLKAQQEAADTALQAQASQIAKLKEQLAERVMRTADTLKVRELQLVDPDGRPRIQLHFIETRGADERPALEFFDRRGESQASYTHEGMFLTRQVRGRPEHTSFWIGGVSIATQSHNLRLCATGTSSFVNLDDRATLMATAGGADLTLNDGEGARRMSVSVSNREGPSLMLFDANLKPRIAFDISRSATAPPPSDALPGIRVLDAEGRLRLGLGCASGPMMKAVGTGALSEYSLLVADKDGNALFKAP